MKKQFLTVFALIATTFIYNSCIQEEFPENEALSNESLTLIASKQLVNVDPSTKTVMNGGEVEWSKAEKITAFVNGKECNTTDSPTASTEVKNDTGGKQLAITLNGLTAGDQNIQVLRGTVGANHVPGTEGGFYKAFNFELPEQQHSSSFTFDQNADALISENKTVTTTVAPSTDGTTTSTSDLMFGRLFAITKLLFTFDTKYKDAIPQKVTFSAPLEKNIAGSVLLNPQTMNFVTTDGETHNEQIFNSGTNQISIIPESSEPINANGKWIGWMVAGPVTFNANEIITISLETKDQIFTKTITLKEPYSLLNSNLNIIKIDMKKVTPTNKAGIAHEFNLEQPITLNSQNIQKGKNELDGEARYIYDVEAKPNIVLNFGEKSFFTCTDATKQTGYHVLPTGEKLIIEGQKINSIEINYGMSTSTTANAIIKYNNTADPNSDRKYSHWEATAGSELNKVEITANEDIRIKSIVVRYSATESEKAIFTPEIYVDQPQITFEATDDNTVTKQINVKALNYFGASKIQITPKADRKFTTNFDGVSKITVNPNGVNTTYTKITESLTLKLDEVTKDISIIQKAGPLVGDYYKVSTVEEVTDGEYMIVVIDDRAEKPQVALKAIATSALNPLGDEITISTIENQEVIKKDMTTGFNWKFNSTDKTFTSTDNKVLSYPGDKSAINIKDAPTPLTDKEQWTPTIYDNKVTLMQKDAKGMDRFLSGTDTTPVEDGVKKPVKFGMYGDQTKYHKAILFKKKAI